MGYLSDIWDVLQEVKQQEALKSEPDFFKVTSALIEGFSQHGALDSFYFSHCGMDKGSYELYAVLGLSRQEPELIVPLTRNDLNDLQISIDQVKNQLLGVEIRKVFDRFEKVVDSALREMNIHEKTADFIRKRDGIVAPIGTSHVALQV